MTTKFHALILKSEIKDNVYPGDSDVSGTVTCFGENFMVNSLLLFCFCFCFFAMKRFLYNQGALKGRVVMLPCHENY